MKKMALLVVFLMAMAIALPVHAKEVPITEDNVAQVKGTWGDLEKLTKLIFYIIENDQQKSDGRYNDRYIEKVDKERKLYLRIQYNFADKLAKVSRLDFVEEVWTIDKDVIVIKQRIVKIVDDGVKLNISKKYDAKIVESLEGAVISTTSEELELDDANNWCNAIIEEMFHEIFKPSTATVL